MNLLARCWPTLLVPALVGQDDAAPEAVAAPDSGSLAAWIEHIEPAPGELAWEAIPWQPTVGDGLRAAAAAGKPLLLWVMNGHPLGCT